MCPQHARCARKSIRKVPSRKARRQQVARSRPRLLVELLEPRVVMASGAIGDQFLVAETFGFESSPPALVVNLDGTFTAAWESFEEDGNGFGIFAQRFSADGIPLLADRFQVNTTSEGDQSAPVIASDSAGNTLIAWQSKDQDGSGYGIYGQWYDASGIAMGTEFQINATIVGDQSSPSLAIDGSGKVTVRTATLPGFTTRF